MHKIILALGVLIVALSGCAWLFGPTGGRNEFPSRRSHPRQPVPDNETLRPELETPSEIPNSESEFQGPELQFPESSSADSRQRGTFSRSYIPASLTGWKGKSDAGTSTPSTSSEEVSNPPLPGEYVELPPPPSSK